MKITAKRILESLSWLVEDAKWRHDQTHLEGRYSPELQEAIKLKEELEKLPPDKIISKNPLLDSGGMVKL